MEQRGLGKPLERLLGREIGLEVELNLDLELERKRGLGSKLELHLAPEPELHVRHALERLSFRCAASQIG